MGAEAVVLAAVPVAEEADMTTKTDLKAEEADMTMKTDLKAEEDGMTKKKGPKAGEEERMTKKDLKVEGDDMMMMMAVDIVESVDIVGLVVEILKNPSRIINNSYKED